MTQKQHEGGVSYHVPGKGARRARSHFGGSLGLELRLQHGRKALVFSSEEEVAVKQREGAAEV